MPVAHAVLPKSAVAALALAIALFHATSARAGWRAEGPDLGAVLDLSVEPGRPDTVYAATHNGGVWRSDDFGRTWTLPGADLTGWRVEWVEADPGTPGTVWAGVDDPGEPALYRSRDRGASWERVTDRVQGGALGSVHATGVRIAFAPSKPAEIWVPSTNLHFRSRDGGRTWSDFRVPDQDAYAIAVDAADPRVVYAGGRGQTHQLSRSDDGGGTWKKVGAGLEERSVSILLVDPSQSATVYLVAGFADLWKSTDRGESFAKLALPAGATDDCYRLQLDPSDPRVLWAATEAGLFRSPDGGATWARRERGTGRYLVRAVAFDPREPRRMLAASAGVGVYRSEDGGESWSASASGLAAGWIEGLHGLACAPVLFAQTSVGLYRLEGEGRWSEVQAPFESDDKAVELDGLLFDRRAAGTVWAFDGSRAWRSMDGGRRFEELKAKEPSLREMMKGDLASAQFHSLTLDAGDPQVVYAGSWSHDEPGQAVFKSVDGGKSFKPSGNGLPGAAVTALAGESPGEVFAVVAEHGLFRTGDGGRSWAAAGRGLPEVELRQLAVDPSVPARLYVATEQGLFRSVDQGASFAAVGGPLAGEDVEAVVVAADGRVFAASFHGVFWSAAGGASFAPLTEGLPLADVRALSVAGPAPGRLYAGTAGTSVWSIELP